MGRVFVPQLQLLLLLILLLLLLLVVVVVTVAVTVVVVAGVVEQISVQILDSPELDLSRITNKTGHPWVPCKTDSFNFS